MSERLYSAHNSAGRYYPTAELNECPYPYFDHVRADRPVFQDPGTGSHAVFRHEDILFVLARDELFTMEELPDGLKYGETRSLGHTDQPAHTAMRKFAYTPLKPKRLRDYDALVHECADTLIDGFAGSERVEFVQAFAYPFPTLVISRLMGLPSDEETWDRLQRFSNLLGGGDGPVGDMTIPLMHEHIRGWVTERAEAPGEDLLSELIVTQRRQEGEVNLEYLVTLAAELIGGSVITTGQMIASAMMLLLQNPEQMEKVRADRSLIPAALEETLRVESPVQWHPRYAQEDVELPSGEVIPAGAHVMLVYASGNRDPVRFPEPEVFDVNRPRRQLKAHFGFGYGVHFCLGAPLARLEGTVAFEHLFDRFDTIAMAPGNDFRHIENLHFRAVRELHLEFTARQSAAA